MNVRNIRRNGDRKQMGEAGKVTRQNGDRKGQQAAAPAQEPQEPEGKTPLALLKEAFNAVKGGRLKKCKAILAGLIAGIEAYEEERREQLENLRAQIEAQPALGDDDQEGEEDAGEGEEPPGKMKQPDPPLSEPEGKVKSEARLRREAAEKAAALYGAQ